MDVMYIQRFFTKFCRILPIALLAISAVTFVKPVQALGVGAAVSDSYIGEVLLVSIPLFNIENPDSLIVEFETSDFKGLKSEIDRSNSQLSIRVRSEQIVNEPYLSFTLKLIDSGNAFSKEFVVLLDLPPSGRLQPAIVDDNFRDATTTLASSNVMGPYEWAEQGRVVNKFGAVLDGQSLWRVARRINKALGVSLNQMMWGLYQANPQAFSGRSISTLRAGSFLNIPTAAEVSQFSDEQAQAQLKFLEGQAVASLASPSSVSGAASEKTGATSKQSSALAQTIESQPTLLEQAPSNEQNVSDQVEPPFQLTTIDQAAQSSLSSTLTADQKSQEIISSLAQTVGDLTQELIRKDKKIAFLEEKVEALRGLGRVDNASLLENANIDAPIASQVKVDTSIDDRDAQSWFKRWWLILLAVLAIICALVYAFRERLIALYESLNLFGNARGLEFERSHIEYDVEGESFELERNDQTNQPVFDALNKGSQEIDLDKGVSFSDFTGYIELRDVDGHERIAGQSFDDERYEDLEEVLEEGIEEELVEDFDELESEQPLEFETDIETDLCFSKQFNKLLESNDYERAREFLDTARYNQIDEGVYHCERLQLLYNKKNVDGFYNYFYSVESKVPSFDKSCQTRISQMLVSLWS